MDAISRQVTEARDELRDHLGTILTVGKVVSRTIPGVTVPTRGVRPRTSDAVFLATAGAAVAEAESFREAFIQAGMPEDLPARPPSCSTSSRRSSSVGGTPSPSR
ncbi:MAG: hypothetical protein IPK12_24755 [Gemmatimonadetes bacterium]|nr:hypothetical protein [Gemmatimonadota bacterium]